MSSKIRSVFDGKSPKFVAYVTAGFPTIAESVDILLTLQKGV